jgi:aminoglycoside phosphotransferase (APT) family kinase protein
MTRPRDQEIVTAFMYAGLARPQAIRSVPGLGSGVLQVVTDNQVFLVELFTSKSTSSFGQDRLARELATSTIPSGDVMSLGQGMSMPATVGQWGPGSPVLGQGPETLGRALGDVTAALQRVPVGGRRRATFVDQHVWVPRCARWSTEILGHATLARQRSRGHLGSVPEALLSFITSRAEALDADPAPVLVHGGLTAGRIWHDRGDLRMVTGWQSASIGDPEQDFAQFIYRPDLTHIVGAGARPIAQAILDSEDALARMEAHAARHLLERIADAPAAQTHRGALFLGEAAQAATRLLAGDAGKTIRLALQGKTAALDVGPPQVLTRRVLALLTTQPSQDTAGASLCAMGLLELGSQYPEHRHGLLALAHRHLDPITSAETTSPWPIADGTPRQPHTAPATVLRAMLRAQPQVLATATSTVGQALNALSGLTPAWGKLDKQQTAAHTLIWALLTMGGERDPVVMASAQRAANKLDLPNLTPSAEPAADTVARLAAQRDLSPSHRLLPPALASLHRLDDIKGLSFAALYQLFS